MQTYKDNPLWNTKFTIDLVNALVPERLQIGDKYQLGFRIDSTERITFSLHHLYGSKYQEKTCTVTAVFNGENLVIDNVTTPHSKNDMRARNRKLIGRSIVWAPYVTKRENDALHG